MMDAENKASIAATIRKVALVFDDQTRPETTGIYCRRTLEQLVEVTFFHPSALAEVPREAFDLYLNIDDGMRYQWPADLHPCAWWAIDTHIDFAWSLQKAGAFDLVFAAQRDGAALLRREGIVSAQWLPLACDPQMHGRREIAKQFDVCFVGNLIPGPRVDLVRLIQQRVKNVYVGQAYFEEMAKIYSSSHIVFNRSVKNDVNMRVFEALASGSLLLTNDISNNGQAELFGDGVHLATYSDGHDLLDKLRYYLRRDDVREKIAAAGREEVLAKHTYRHRMEEVLRQVASGQWTVGSGQQGWNAESASGRPHPSPGYPLAGAEGEGEKAPSLISHPSSLIHDLSYFDFARPEVLALIPTTARRVLEIGCGTGRLGEALKRRQPCEVVGVEIDPAAAEKATERLDRVIVGDIERLELDSALQSKIENPKSKIRFDCLVCADVLEHLVDPVGFLRRARKWLKDDAAVVASIPNVRHHSVVGSLIEGNWTYEPAGLLDNTHLHFFTRRDAEAMFAQTGYEVEKLQFVSGSGYEEWQQQPDKTQVHLGSVRLTDVPAEEAEEFFVYQFLVTARPVAELVRVPAEETGQCVVDSGELPEKGAPIRGSLPDGQCKMQNAKCPGAPGQNDASGSKLDSKDLGHKTQDLRPTTSPPNSKSNPGAPGENPKSEWPMCLVLMVTYNRLEYTRLALEAVLKLDYPNLKIVVWDNASTDGTAEYLRERLAAEHGWKTGCNAARPHPGPLPEGPEGEGEAERHRGRSLQNAPELTLIESPVNRGVVFPMNEVWSSDPEAELLAKIDNDTLVPPEMLRRLADCHHKSKQVGVVSGFHFRQEGEALAEEHRIRSFDGVRMLPQPYVGGCAVMIRAEVFRRMGAIGCRNDGPQQKPFMDSGWTLYQQRLTEAGMVNGYPWPPIHVDHMEDTRSPHCIRSDEHQRYKHEERGMGLDEFTKELCVWRPNWIDEPNGDGRHSGLGLTGQAALLASRPVVQASPEPIGGTKSCAEMRFRQDFTRDFHEFDFWGKPFAFARFADGERAICMGTPIQGQDDWSFDGRQAAFAAELNAALRYDAPGYYVGISDGCCDRPAKEWYLAQIRLPLERVTFSNIFVNANYRRFQRLDTSDMAIVASEGGDYWVPEDAMNCGFNLDRLVEKLLAVDRPILVSAGPASCIIIHKYWQRAVKRQVIVDVGSAIDERTKGRKTRQYQVPGTRTAELHCTW